LDILFIFFFLYFLQILASICPQLGDIRCCRFGKGGGCIWDQSAGHGSGTTSSTPLLAGIGIVQLLLERRRLLGGKVLWDVVDGPEDGGQVEGVIQATGRGQEHTFYALKRGIVVDGARRVGQIEGLLDVELLPLVDVVLGTLGHATSGHRKDAASSYGDGKVPEAKATIEIKDVVFNGIINYIFRNSCLLLNG